MPMMIRVVLVGGSRGTSPSLDLTFPPTGLSENLGGIEKTGPKREPVLPVLVLVVGDGQDARAVHGSSRSVMVQPSAFVLNGPRLVVVATLG